MHTMNLVNWNVLRLKVVFNVGDCELLGDPTDDHAGLAFLRERVGVEIHTSLPEKPGKVPKVFRRRDGYLNTLLGGSGVGVIDPKIDTPL